MPFAYGHIFKDNIAKLKREGRYRIFADILRHRGEFPAADHHTPNGVRDITVWCSNDYLVHGPAPGGDRRHEGRHRQGRRRVWRHAEYLRYQPFPCRNWRQELAALHGKEAALLFTSGFVSNEATPVNARAAPARLHLLLRRTQSRLDDRRHAPFRRGEAHLPAQRHGASR